MTAQKFDRVESEFQLKNVDTSSIFATMSPSCGTVNFVLPLPFCAHCCVQKPTVRGQFCTAQRIVVAVSSVDVTGVVSVVPEQVPDAVTLLRQRTSPGQLAPPVDRLALASNVRAIDSPFASVGITQVTVPFAPTAGSVVGCGLAWSL